MPTEEANPLDVALRALTQWLLAHDAAELAANLAPPAAEAELARYEAWIGPFPAPLRALYLRHNGQPDRDRWPLFEALTFTDLEYGGLLHEGMLWSYLGGDPSKPGGELDRTKLFPDPAAPLRDEEFSPRWWPLAEGNSAFLAVNLDTGRVFRFVKDVPALRLAAEDVGRFLAEYAAAVQRGDYDIAGDPALPGVRVEGLHARGKHLLHGGASTHA